MSNKVRVRFAPSPTGPLHIGGVRTALFNYLFARKHGGDFLLRIEDTDSQRFVPGAEEYINEALAWCGIRVDEGVNEGGPHAPYRQSERKGMYLKHAEALVKSGWAYYAFDTPEELEDLRKEREGRGESFSYNHTARECLKNSLVLPEDEVKKLIESGVQWVIRFKMPKNVDLQMEDLIRGRVVVNTSTLDDKVLFKSADMLPTYHLANVADDYAMNITHVIRGEEWLPSLPLHVMLYRAMGWEDAMPKFAHLPLILKPTGNGKLSKRDGDKMGFPVFPLQWTSPKGEVSSGYREDGYLPEAFVNMLALLGWNPGTEQELFTMDELIEIFTLERVNKAGARFDPEKSKWFNHQYILSMPNLELAQMFIPLLKEKGVDAPGETVERVVSMVKERVSFVHELWDQASFFFAPPTDYDPKPVKKFWNQDSPDLMKEFHDLLAKVEPFTAPNIEPAIKGRIAEKEYGMGKVMNALRLCLVGESKGPGIADICEIVGKQGTLDRIQKAIDEIG